jgi:hypothetical protein
MKGHNSAGMNRKSVQAQPLLGHFSLSDVRYWQRAVFPSELHGKRPELPDESLGDEGGVRRRRETFPLGTP